MTEAKKRYEQWVGNPNLDPELLHELEAISNQPNEIEERFYTHLTFGTGGMRGEIGAGTNRINRYTIRKATLGLSQYVQNVRGKNSNEIKSVVIAYDCRHKSELFALESALTLANQGIKAYVYPSLRSTPQLSFTVRKLQADAGIVITASHNPPEYNGFKVYGADGAQLNLEGADKVISYVNQIEDELAIKVMEKDHAIQEGLLVFLDEAMDQQYFDYVASLVLQPEVIHETADHFKIVFTSLHGTGLLPVQQVLKQVGFKQVHCIEEQAIVDPNFSTVKSPNPEEPEAFTMAVQYAKENGADIIMGTDPDSDRMGIVIKNPSGEFQVLTGNQTGSLLLHYILSVKKERNQISELDKICKTIVTSEMGREVGKEFGVQTIDTLTGFKFIGEKINEFYEEGTGKFIFGYEESYGYLIGDEVRDKDAIQAVLIAAEMGAYYKSKGMTLYQALEELFETYGYFKEDLISITLKGKEGLEKIKNVLQFLRSESPEQVAGQDVTVKEDYQRQQRIYAKTGKEEAIDLPPSDVLKYFLEDGTWFCIRPSGTEPKLKIYIGVNGSSSVDASEKLATVKKGIEDIIYAKV
jgi:phosphoglucomutase